MKGTVENEIEDLKRVRRMDERSASKNEAYMESKSGIAEGINVYLGENVEVMS